MALYRTVLLFYKPSDATATAKRPASADIVQLYTSVLYYRHSDATASETQWCHPLKTGGTGVSWSHLFQNRRLEHKKCAF